MHAADRNTNCVQHNKTHVAHTMTENGARVSEPRHVTETQDMSAGIQTPRSNMKQGTQTRMKKQRSHENADMMGVSGLCHKTMNNPRPK